MLIEYTRPPLPEYQKKIIDDPARFTIVEGATKTGKTVCHIVWIVEQTLMLTRGQHTWWVAPVYSQAKIAYERTKLFITDKRIFKANDSALSITFLNGAILQFKSGDKPDNLYGEDVYDAVVDEFTRLKMLSWYAIVSTLTATEGRAKLIGNVKGTGWGYQLAQKAKTGQLGSDWKYYSVTADDAIETGILSKEMVDAARNTLPKGVFLELYYNIPNTTGADKFCYSFNKDEHVGECSGDMDYPLYLSFDFNYNPICCGVYQFRQGVLFCIRIIKLENSNIYSLCSAIRSTVPGYQWVITGDATGKASSALVKDNLNYYKIIKKELSIPDSRMKVPTVNPTMEENQVLVNAVLEHVPTLIDPNHAAPLISDCEYVRVDNNGKIIKTDRNDETQQADALDTFRYLINFLRKKMINL